MAFADFISALRGAPITAAQLNKDEARLLAEQQRIKRATIHIDDVVAKAVAGTRKRAADAVAHLVTHHLNAGSMAATHPDNLEEDNPAVFDLLSLTEGRPHPANGADPNSPAAIFPQGRTPHAGILTHLLLPQVERATEALIREHLTDACKGGMRLSERRKRLADIDAKLEAIKAQRGELVEGMREAARHLEGRAAEAIAKGPSDADVAAEVREYERATGARVVEAQ